ncbi:MAG: hypothetical protein K2O32_05935 [Acetatifactor sp.]|nr:hypothetical protein [Acetatifactor sp.]
MAFVPMVLCFGYRTVKDKKSFSKLVDLVNEFLAGYDANEEYKKYILSGSSGSENVTGRLEYCKNLMRAI